jgi:hypothetical protein
MSLLLLLLSTLLPVVPQAPPAAPPPEAVAAGSGGGEMQTLDFAERRIVEEDFHASRAIRLVTDRPGVALDAGVALGARRIEVTLHNVKGSYRFRSRLTALHPSLRALPEPAEGPPSTQNR